MSPEHPAAVGAVNWIYALDIIDGPLPVVVWALTAACALALMIRRPTRRWVVASLIGVIAGTLLGAATVLLVNITNALGVTMPSATTRWMCLMFAAFGLAVASLASPPRRRKALSIVLVVLSILSATLGVNAAFGINRTVGTAFGVSTQNPIDGLVSPPPTKPITGPLYQRWSPPAGMPATGKTGLLTGSAAIASSAGFAPRDASIYLPPAAQVENAPALPLVVMMMGQPGNPEPDFIAAALDELAAKNRGLAPIVIIADQLGDPDNDPVCADSAKYGGVETYFNKDIVAYAKKTLNVIQDPRYWSIAGYSNGGSCAFTWASKHPEIWGNLVVISGNEWPGDENEQAAIADVYGGDESAYEAAEAAGFTSTNYVVPGADHGATALQGGLPFAFGVLYPRLGLAAPVP